MKVISNEAAKTLCIFKVLRRRIPLVVGEKPRTLVFFIPMSAAPSLLFCAEDKAERSSVVHSWSSNSVNNLFSPRDPVFRFQRTLTDSDVAVTLTYDKDSFAVSYVTHPTFYLLVTYNTDLASDSHFCVVRRIFEWLTFCIMRRRLTRCRCGRSVTATPVNVAIYSTSHFTTVSGRLYTVSGKNRPKCFL